MNKTMKIVTILAGCIFFGVAMGLRGCFDSIWMRVAIAAVGGVGLAIALGLAFRNLPG
jgi:hypothetical protein